MNCDCNLLHDLFSYFHYCKLDMNKLYRYTGYRNLKLKIKNWTNHNQFINTSTMIVNGRDH